MLCGDCKLHSDDGEPWVAKIADAHFTVLPSVPRQRYCMLNDKAPWLVGSFNRLGKGTGMSEDKHPLCPHREV